MTWLWRHGCGWLEMLMDDPVDMTLTDPPYSEYVYEKSRRTRTGRQKFDLEHSALTDAQIALGCYAIAKQTRRAAILFLDIEIGVPRWRRGLEQHGMRYMATGIWHKEPYTPQMTGDRGAVNYEAYLIMQAGGVAPKWNGGGHGICITHPPAPSVKGRHPTEKPIDLLEILIKRYSDRGERVGDPYGGRASTVAAAIRTGRIGVGTELDAGHYERGLKRLQFTREPLGLFSEEQEMGGTPPPPPLPAKPKNRSLFDGFEAS